MNNEEKQKNIVRRAERILQISASMAASISYQVENRLAEIELHYEGYAEPGYDVGDSGLVATGNWNEISSYDYQTQVTTHISDLPKRIADLFEKMGIECEWNDEWIDCSQCGKLVRSQPDSYSWTPSYFFSEHSCDITCMDCIQKDPEGYLSELEDNDSVANTINKIDPADHGYIQVNEDSYKTGWYPGQHDSPKEIAKELRNKGISRFLFNIDSVGQFDMHWNLFVHKDEEHLLNASEDESEDNESEDNESEDEIVEEDEVVAFNKETDTLLGVIINANDSQCKVCGVRLNMGETPCWKCGLNNPTIG